MITIHSIIVRYSDRFKRWYGYLDSGLLVYFDFSVFNLKPISGDSYDVLGLPQPVARHVDGGPVFNMIVTDFTALINE